MDWLALLLNMRGTHQLRSVFEEGVLAHQPIRRAATVVIMEIRLPLSCLGISTWTTGIVRRLQFGAVTAIAWATPFGYALSVFWEPSLRIRLQYHG